MEYLPHHITHMKSVLAKNIQYLLDGPGLNQLGIHTTQERSGYRRAIEDVFAVLDSMPYQKEYREGEK